jgi:TolB-like protein
MKRRTAWLALLAAAVAPGCASYYYGEVGAASGLQADLLQANQQAADALLQSARLDPRASVLVATLVNVDRLGESSRLGRLCSEQIAGRLVQRGVPVTEVRLREQLALQPAQGELLLSRELREVSQAHQAQAVVVGTYAASPRQVFISLKLVRPEGNLVVAAQDYAVPMTAELRGLLTGR